MTAFLRRHTALGYSSGAMFIASKLLSFATQPLAWVLVLLLAALLRMSFWRNAGKGLMVTALAVLTLQGWEPAPDALLRHLERQHPLVPTQAPLQQYQGVLVLGGALSPAYIWSGHDQAALNDAAERMTVPIALLAKHPTLRLLFTGGEGELFSNDLSEAARAKIFFDGMGVAPERVIYESQSRTTYENAIFSKTLPGVDPSQPWLLLTSAFHMPRAMATFDKAGWNVTPYPVDYRVGMQTPWSQYSLEQGARKWHLALHEMVGLLAYRLAGRA